MWSSRSSGRWAHGSGRGPLAPRAPAALAKLDPQRGDVARVRPSSPALLGWARGSEPQGPGPRISGASPQRCGQADAAADWARARARLQRAICPPPVRRPPSQATYDKRKRSLMRKAMELAVMCNSQVALVMFDDKGRLTQVRRTGCGLREGPARFTRRVLPPRDNAAPPLPRLLRTRHMPSARVRSTEPPCACLALRPPLAVLDQRHGPAPGAVWQRGAQAPRALHAARREWRWSRPGRLGACSCAACVSPTERLATHGSHVQPVIKSRMVPASSLTPRLAVPALRCFNLQVLLGNMYANGFGLGSTSQAAGTAATAQVGTRAEEPHQPGCGKQAHVHTPARMSWAHLRAPRFIITLIMGSHPPPPRPPLCPPALATAPRAAARRSRLQPARSRCWGPWGWLWMPARSRRCRRAGGGCYDESPFSAGDRVVHVRV